MIIIGIDPGSAVTGFGIIESEKSRYSLVDYGCIRTKTNVPFPDRLREIYQELKLVIDKYHPDHAAVEDVFFSENARTALKIGHARGVVLLALAHSQIPIAEYSPREVKQAVVGSGGASKRQVQFMIKSLLQLKEVPSPEDAADALAVALCHAHRMKLEVIAQAFHH